MSSFDDFLFGTVGSPKSTAKKPGGSIGGIIRLKELDFSALELGWVQSVRVSEETCDRIKRTCAEQGISLSVHAPYFINLNANEGEWPNSRKRLMDAAHYGNLAGATDIVFHPGSYFAQPTEEVLERSIGRLRDCANDLREVGNLVTLRPETMGKPSMLGSLEDTLRMSQAIPGVEPCLDFAHLHARAGDGSMNTKDEWIGVLNGYAQYLGRDALRKLHIHMSGILYGQKGEKEHLPLAKSDFNLADLFLALSEMGCAGRILCESPEMEYDAFLMRQEWQKIVG